MKFHLTIGRTLALVCCLGAVALSSIAVAQRPELQRVDLELRDADLLQATRALTIQTGIQFVIEPTTQEFALVNLSLRDITAETAIDYIARAAGGFAERDENGIYVLRYGAPAPKVQEQLPPVARPIIRRTLKIMHADPENIYAMIVQGAALPPVFDDSAMMNRSFSTGPNIINMGTAVPAATPSTAGTFNYDSGIVLPGERSNQRGGGFQPGGGGGGGFQPGGGGGGGIGGGGGQPGGGAGGGGSSPGDLQGGQGLVPEGIDRVIYDPTTNSLIVQGTEEAIRELEDLVAQLDVAPQQVVIQVQFVTTSDSLDEALGIDWLYARGSQFAGSRPGSFARASDPIFLNYATGNITARLRTLLTEGGGRTVNAPIIRTLNNQPAIFSVQTTTTIFINQIVSTAGGIIIQPQPQPLSVTTFLAVRPRINGDGTITMTLQPQIADFGQLRRGPDGQEIPDQLQQSLQVVARVQNGETIALAGFTRKQESSSVSRIPILSDIPIIGQLFRGRNQQRNNSELLIFVTPTIVEAGDAGLGAP